jgi:hypothetical protein
VGGVHDGSRLGARVDDEADDGAGGKDGVGPEEVVGGERVGLGGRRRQRRRRGAGLRLMSDRSNEGVNVLDRRVGCEHKRRKIVSADLIPCEEGETHRLQ